jgi:hypothetical protein
MVAASENTSKIQRFNKKTASVTRRLLKRPCKPQQAPQRLKNDMVQQARALQQHPQIENSYLPPHISLPNRTTWHLSPDSNRDKTSRGAVSFACLLNQAFASTEHSSWLFANRAKGCEFNCFPIQSIGVSWSYPQASVIPLQESS